MTARGPCEAEKARVRRVATAAIKPLYREHMNGPEIAFILAVGEACPFSLRWQHEIWLEEIYRIAYVKSVDESREP
jgi:hypothetical protein